MNVKLSRGAVAPFLICGLVILSGLVSQLVSAQEVRPFTERFGENARGDIVLVGNVLMTCDSADADCADVQQGLVTGNNNRAMAYVNIDPAAGFINSSSADLSLPAGAEVLYAGLYWGGRADPADSERDQIQLRAPGETAYTQLTASQLDTITAQGTATTRPFQAGLDVTSIVAAAGNGTYFVGDLNASLGQDGLGFYGGWALVVAYRDESQPLRRLTIFDGAANVAGSDTISTTVTGLLTPLSGSFETFLGALVWEGDEGIVGDSVALDGTVLSDALNPPDNFWNSSITRLGERIDAKSPDYVNQLAVDINYVDASGILANGATEAEILFSTNGDAYFPHALAFVVDLFAPDLVASLEKSVAAPDGEPAEPGDVLEYTISFSNVGQDGATEVVLTDPIPANTVYVPGTLEIVSNAGTGPVGPMSDASGDDQAEFDGVNNQVVFRLGEGADANNGGLVASGEGASVRFRVQVVDDASNYGATISNTVTVAHSAETLGGDYTGEASADIVLAQVADLGVTKVVNQAQPEVGSVVSFTITVTNDGPADATGVVAEDVLPSGYTFVDASASQGSYDAGTGLWSIGNLADGASVSLVIEATVNESGDYLNSVTVQGNEPDTNPDNNSDEVDTDPVVDPALELEKLITAGDTFAQPGDTIAYQLTAHNVGNVSLSQVSIDDPLLADLSCTPGQPATLAPGESLVCTGEYSVVQADIDAGSVLNTATASALDGDSNTLSASDSAQADGPTADPALTLVKQAGGPGPYAQGEWIDYTIVASNTGNVTLPGLIVEDPMISLSCTPAIPLELAPGASVECVGSYQVTADDANAGQDLLNVATASSDLPGGGSVDASDDVSVSVTSTPIGSAPVPVPVMGLPGRMALIFLTLMVAAWGVRWIR